MKKILKNPTEPASLTKHRSVAPNSTYSDYVSKNDLNDLRDSLLNEQGYICCYCMASIDQTKIKIEHFKPRSKYSQLNLNYQNMLGVCLGGEGKPKHLHHCDTSKADQEISLNPANSEINCEEFIHYLENGQICSNDPKIDEELNKILKLNLQNLVENRKAVINALKRTLNDKNILLDEMLNKLKAKSEEGKYQAYCQVSISYIEKQISQLEKSKNI